MSGNRNAMVAGVGMVPFTKPGQSHSWQAMGVDAAKLALADADIPYCDVGQAYAGFVYADSTAGQSVMYDLGLTGIPVINVNNNCATGSTALFLARQAVQAGVVDVALAVGFEQMNPGALGIVFNDRVTPMAKHLEAFHALHPSDPDVPSAARWFGEAGRDHQQRYGTSDETFARITVKARQHASRNPFAIFRTPLSIEEVMGSPHIVGPLTRFQCCPPTCGAAAAVIVSPDYARRKGLTGLVEIVGQAMSTDNAASFDPPTMMQVVGFGMAELAARSVYEQAGVGPEDVQVCELHDCFTANELISYESLGLCGKGEAEQFVNDGDNTYGGRIVTNPSGGLLSKGHPIGATGLAQCYELVQQLRGTADKRQVEGIRNALQHNLGLGGACVVTMYRQAG